MELDTFIKQTLVQIRQGVKEANVEIKSKEGTGMYQITSNRSGEKDLGISFDVAVTVTSEKKSEGEGKINVVGISLGGAKNSASTEQNTSRIKFKVDPFNPIT